MTPKLDLRHLRQFLAVCDAGGVQGAAARVGVTTAAVSKSIIAIERELGVRLFERLPSGVRLTPAGAHMLMQSREVLDRFETLLESLTPYRRWLAPRLRLYMVESLAPFLMPPIAEEYGSRVGELSLECGYIRSYADELLLDRFEVIVGPESLDDVPGAEQYLLVEDPLILVCPASVPADERSVASLVRRYPLIRFARGRPMDRMTDLFLAQQGIHPLRSLECSTAHPLIEMVSRGLGCALTTPLAVAFARPSPENVAFVALPGASGRRICLIALRDRLADLPARMADLCGESLRREALPIIASISPEVAAQVRIPPTAPAARRRGQGRRRGAPPAPAESAATPYLPCS